MGADEYVREMKACSLTLAMEQRAQVVGLAAAGLASIR